MNIKNLEQTSEEKRKDKIVEDVPIYKKLYPPLKNIFTYDENNEINNNLIRLKSKIIKGPKRTNFLKEDDEDSNEELTADFLNDLVKNPCPISKTRIVDSVSKFIQNSQLIEKLEADYQSDKKLESKSLSKLCAERLGYIEATPGEIIFKIGEAGDRFYFILSGNISILKLKEIPNIEMTYIQYIQYCLFLINSKEDYLLNEVIKANDSVLSLSSVEDIKTINKIIFMRELNQSVNRNIINNSHLKLFFEQNGQKYEDYDINPEDLDNLEKQKINGIQGAGKEWENYITKRIKLTVSEQVFFQPYENILTDEEPKKIICFCYHSFLYLGRGLFFGDNALDFENNKRNATIRAEEKTILAYLKREDYLSIISPKNKMEKLKELDFIYENYFFKGINPHIFERNYFHLFSPREYFRGSILFSHGTIPRALILLKTGRISLELKGSVIDIHNLIKYIYNNIFTNPIFSKLSQGNKHRYLDNQKLSIIKNYINDPILTRLKMHNSKFIEDMNVVRNYQISIITDNESIGLEEIFLRLPYIMKSTVVSEKIYCYELGLEHIDKMLNNGKDVIYSYIKFSINKIISLIERLQNIKQNSINMSLIKYEKEIFLKIKGFKINDNNNNSKNTSKEKIRKIDKNRNKKFIKKDLKEKNTIKDFNKIKDEEKSHSKVINQNTASPIKIFVTNISQKSKSMFEKMQLTYYKKLQKRNYKFKNNLFTSTTSNNTMTLNPTINKRIKDSINNNKSKSFFTTKEVNNEIIYEMRLMKKLENINNNNRNSEIISKFQNDSSYREQALDKNFTGKYTTESESDQINYNFTNKFPLVNKNIFNLSYIPLDLMCQNKNSNSSLSNYNDILNTKNIYTNILKKSYSSVLDTNSTNNSIIKSNSNINKDNKHDKNKEFKNKLKLITRKFQANNNSENKTRDLSLNIVNRRNLITSIIKDFYKGIRLNGYTSFIHNKEINTIFMRKYNKKYDSAEKVHHNIKLHLLKGNDSLPLIS